jgi:hypothetical protein
MEGVPWVWGNLGKLENVPGEFLLAGRGRRRCPHPKLEPPRETYLQPEAFSTWGSVRFLNVDARNQLAERVRATLVYLGIVTTFTTATLIICAAWLLVW